MNAHNFIDLSGLKFGRLTAIEQASRLRKKVPRWSCLCECGNTVIIEGKNLRCGASKSCGCLLSEVTQKRATTHGMTDSPEYKIWRGMKTRCYNSKERAYPFYGGRGITICDRWIHSFEAFYSDLGARPSDNHSIERIDVNGNYEPGNCEWIPSDKQAANKRNNRNITHNGRTMILADWAREVGIKAETISHRINIFGWNIEKALTKDPREYHHPKSLQAPPLYPTNR